MVGVPHFEQRIAILTGYSYVASTMPNTPYVSTALTNARWLRLARVDGS